MPVNRNYGGYSGYGGTYSSYVPGMYTSSFASAYGTGGNRAGSQSPATLRATTPARSYGSNMAVLPEEKRMSSPTGSYTSYYSRQKDFYTPSVYSRIYASDYDNKRLERRTINTDEINTEEKKENRRDHAIPGEITRDTTLNVRGGKAVVRMVTTKLKESPYIGGWRARMAEKEEKEGMTLGQRLALKHQIVERPKVKSPTPPPVASKADSGDESEWTWETCSSSEAEEAGPPKKKKTPTPPRRKISPKLIKQKPRSPSPSPPKPLTPEPPKRAAVTYTRSNTTSLCTSDEKKSPVVTRNTSASRWMDRLFGDEKPKPKVPSVRIPNFGNAVSANKSMLDSRVKEQNSPSTVVKSSVTGRPLSWAGIPGAANVQDVQANIHTENKTPSKNPETKKPASSSSSGSSSPPLYKYNPRKPQTYKGAGSQYIVSSDEEAHPVEGLGRGWRPGQPPRGDVVVKMNVEKKSVINSEHSEALATNRALTSHAAISSKVPASMGDKYQIPGLFIKPSVKTAPKSVTKPVEAKLTLKPEGTMSLTTKLVEDKDKPGYQSTIFTPSKSPLLDARKEQRSQLGERQAASTPSAKLQEPTTSPPPGPEPKKEESEESEWEYYTETEPSDEDEKPAQKASLQPPTVGDVKKDEKEKVGVEQNGLKTPPVPSTNGLPASSSKPQTVFPPPSLPTAKPAPKKHPVKVEEVAVVEKKRPVQSKVEMSSSKPVVIGVAALRKTKPDPPPSLPEPIIEEDTTGSGPGYSAPVTFKPKLKQVEEKAKLAEVKPVAGKKSEPVLTAVSKSEAVKEAAAAAAADSNVKKSNASGKSVSATDKNGLAASANVKKSDASAKVASAEPALPSAASQTAAVKKSAAGNTRPEPAQDRVALGQQPKNKETSKNNGVNHAKENAVSEASTKKLGDKATGKTGEVAKVAENENSVAESAPKKSESAPKKIESAPKKTESAPKKTESAPRNTESAPKNTESAPKKTKDPVAAKNLELPLASKTTVEATKKDPKLGSNGVSNGVSNAKKPADPKPANKENNVSAACAPSPVPKTKPEELLSPKPVRKEAKQAGIPPPAPKKTDLATKATKEPKSKDTPAPSQPKKQETNITAEPDVLRQTEFDWTKSPSPMSPKSPSPMSPSPTQMTAASLDRLPSALKNMFVKTENAPKEKTADSPAWFDNVPSESSNKAMKEMNAMKADASRTQTKQSREEANLIKISDVAEKPWYDDEDEDMQELLKNRPTILREIDQTQDRRLTPEENMAVIKMYGGVMFPGGEVEKTPKSWLFKIRKALRGNSGEKRKVKEGSSSSNSSSVSSFTGYSKSPSPELRDCYSDSDDDEKEEIFKNPRNEAPTKYRPSFKKYGAKDFKFLRVLGKGSFGKVLLTELRGSQNYYAVKALKKDAVLEDDDIECTMIERKVLALGVKHPFLCHLFCTFQTDSHLFFVMEYLNGGDLMFHIQQQGRFDTERARFYSAEIVCALKFLHQKGIVYRDLKLDNLLLDYEGHIRIVDFGMCKLQVYLDKTADTFCGTPDYMAPEIIKGMKYTHSVDWWSFGVLLYEMLIGQSPFNGCDEDELFWSICNEQAYFPRFLSKEAKQLLLLLLEKNPANRLGVSESTHGDIRRQPFFRSIDFPRLEAKQIAPPYKPKLKNPMDVSYFDTAFTEEPVKLTPMEMGLMEGLNQDQFKGFSYTNKVYTK